MDVVERPSLFQGLRVDPDGEENSTCGRAGFGVVARPAVLLKLQNDRVVPTSHGRFDLVRVEQGPGAFYRVRKKCQVAVHVVEAGKIGAAEGVKRKSDLVFLSRSGRVVPEAGIEPATKGL